MAESIEIVFPGDLIGKGVDRHSRNESTFIENNSAYSSIIGFRNDNGGVTPLEGIWKPKIGEVVIGVVNDVKNSMYFVDLNYFIKGMIIGSRGGGGGRPRRSFGRGRDNDRGGDEPELRMNDMVVATIKEIENKNTIILEYPKVLNGGTTINIKPTKIPRVIGKNNTMIAQIGELTKSEIIVGMNGLIWMKNGNIALATMALLKIESESHVPGLTERIKKMLTGDAV